MLKNDNPNALDSLELNEVLNETDLFAEELQDKFNNSELTISSFATASSTSCVCTFSTGCCYTGTELQ